jgi:lactose/L-arabinose transport system substrate-binding protein
MVMFNRRRHRDRPPRARRGQALGILVAALVVGYVVLISVLPRVGLPRSTDGRRIVEVWGWNIAAMSLDSLTPAFEQANPEVDVQVKMSGANLQSRFLLSLAGGHGAPDVSQLQEREAGKYTATGTLRDLTPWAAKYEKDFPRSFWATAVEDGKVYAIPWDIAPCAVFYKRWIFEQHQIDPDAIQTWDDFIAAGRLLRERSGGRTWMMPLAIGSLKDPFQMLMQQNGGGVFDEQGRLMLSHPRNVEALELIRKLLDSGICLSLSDQNEMLASYNGDSVATYPGASWMMLNMKDTATSTAGRWGVFRLPAYRPGGIRNSNQGGSVLIIPAQSEVGADAEKFVEYALCTVDAQLQQFKQFGLFPAFLPAHADPRFDEPDPFFGNQHVATLFAEDFEKLQPMNRTRDWDEAERFIGSNLSRWATQRLESEAFLREVERSLARRLGREIAPRPLAAPEAGGER